MINKITRQNNSFGNLKPSIRIGEQEIYEFYREFPNIISTTKLASRLSNIKQSNMPYELRLNLHMLLKRLDLKITSQRLKYYRPDYDDFLRILPIAIKKSGLANCGEMSAIIQNKMLKKDIECHQVSMFIKNDKQKRDFIDHAFLIINLNPKSKLKNPKTWGNKAVIIDPWFKECAPAIEMISKYKMFFKLDENNREKFVFRDSNFFNVKSRFKEKISDTHPSLLSKFISIFKDN